MTGREANPDDVEQLIETGESERIFQRAIMEQGRGQARHTPLPCLPWFVTENTLIAKSRVVVAGPAEVPAVSLLSKASGAVMRRSSCNVCPFMSSADLRHCSFGPATRTHSDSTHRIIFCNPTPFASLISANGVLCQQSAAATPPYSG